MIVINQSYDEHIDDLLPSVITCVDLLELLHLLVEFELRDLRNSL